MKLSDKDEKTLEFVIEQAKQNDNLENEFFLKYANKYKEGIELNRQELSYLRNKIMLYRTEKDRERRLKKVKDKVYLEKQKERKNLTRMKIIYASLMMKNKNTAAKNVLKYAIGGDIAKKDYSLFNITVSLGTIGGSEIILVYQLDNKHFQEVSFVLRMYKDEYIITKIECKIFNNLTLEQDDNSTIFELSEKQIKALIKNEYIKYDDNGYPFFDIE